MTRQEYDAMVAKQKEKLKKVKTSKPKKIIKAKNEFGENEELEIDEEDTRPQIPIGENIFGKSSLCVNEDDEGTWFFNDFRLCIVGQPGSGKSYLVRNCIEQFYKNEMGTIIIFDPQSEYYTLKEHFDFVIFGKEDADVQITPENAGEIAKIIIDEKVHSVIDLQEFDLETKCNIVTNFINSALMIKKERYNPVIFMFEEAHTFAQKGVDLVSVIGSKNAMKMLANTGRKKAYSSIFIGQRITQLHTDITTSCNNFICGLTMSELDMKRNGELCCIKKWDVFKTLKHEFYSFGTNFNNYSAGKGIKFKSLKPKSQHPTPGTKAIQMPKSSIVVKGQIKLFANIPLGESEKKDKQNGNR